MKMRTQPDQSCFHEFGPGSRAFSGVDGQLRFAGGILPGDTNGDGKADFEIQIKGSFGAADLIL